MVLTKWGFFFSGGTPCCQQSVADFLFQRRHGINKMGLFFGGTPCCQQSVADFFVSETPWY